MASNLRSLLQVFCLLWFRFLGLAFCLILGFILAIVPTVSRSMPQPVTTESAAPAISNEDSNLLEAGRQHYTDQRFGDAAVSWNHAVTLFSDQPLQQTLALSYLTAAYQQLGQWDAAERSINRSLELLSTVPNSNQTLAVRAQVYNTLGTLQFAQGHTGEALHNWQIAENFYGQTGDETRYFNNLLNQVQAQQSLGFYHQARKTLHRLEQRLPQQPVSLQVVGYQKLGQTYRLLGELNTARAHLQNAFELANRSAQETGAIQLELANIAQAQGDFATALGLYHQAEQSSEATISVKARLNQLKLLVQHDSAAAQTLASTLPNAIASLPPGRTQIYACINAAQSLIQLPNPETLETAARLLAQAIQLSLELQDKRAEAYARGYLGHVYEISRQWVEAQSLTEQALALASGITAADIAYQWQWQLGRLLQQQHQREQALQAYRAAFDTLQTLRQDLVAVSADLQFSFRDSVEPVYRELVDLLLQPNPNPAPPTIPIPHLPPSSSPLHPAHLTEARDVMEALQVAELNNFFRTACLKAQQVPLDQVAQTTAAVIYSIVLPDRLELIANLPGQPLRQYTSVVTQDELAQTLTEWRFYLEKPFTAPEGRVLGEKLYSWIIAPLLADLAVTNSHTLVFVLDGPLRSAPLAALYNGNRYLVEDFEIALSPGLQLLGPRPLQSTHVSALLAGLTEPRHGFSALTNVKAELETAETFLDSRVLLNQQFTSTALAQQVTKTELPIVHLATHGQFSSTLEDTFLLAWDHPISVDELSRLLRAGDQNRLEPIELLVLSACETAAGDSRATLGLAGLSIQGGARSTLASLWNLNDASGAYFAGQFYRTLTQSSTTKAAALQQAQRAMLNHPDYRHPTYWSAYVLVGNWL
jgi:CHAT domain-containing protein